MTRRATKGHRQDGQLRVTQKELYRRLAAAIDIVHETAVKAVGEDVDATRRSQGLMWVYGYLLGGEVGQLTYLTEEHRSVEIQSNHAVASGIEEYAHVLRAHTSDEDVRDVVEALTGMAERMKGGACTCEGHASVDAADDPFGTPAPEEPEAISAAGADELAHGNVALRCGCHSPRSRRQYTSLPLEWFVGRHVKVAFPAHNPNTGEDTMEHMWVRVTGIDRRALTGVLENHPVWVCPVDYGDTVRVRRSEIEDVSGKGEA